MKKNQKKLNYQKPKISKKLIKANFFYKKSFDYEGILLSGTYIPI